MDGSEPVDDGGGTRGSVPDVRALMAEIRERVRRDVADHRDKLPAFVPTEAAGDGAKRRAGELLHSEELRYLNANYHFARLNLERITSHRPGFVGRLIVKFKRKLMQLIWDTLLRDYLDSEREYQANLVRFLNDMSKYVDARDASNFWELIRKIDVDITRALERIELIADEQNGALRSVQRELIDSFEASARELSKNIGELKSAGAAHGAELKALDGVVRGMEGVVARLKVGAAELPRAAAAAPHAGQADYSYLMLENRFRGSEDEISARLEPYVEIFRGATKPVLEIGGGRGELQRLLKSAAVDSYMVDIDAAMVEAASERGIDARLGDGIAHLRSLPAHSLGGLIAVQVVEHLPRRVLEELCAEAVRTVAPGGSIVFETINPQSVLALSSNYFRDPTHVFPMHPDTLRYMLELSGARDVTVRYLSPVSTEAQLRLLEPSEHMPPRWAYTVELLNHNLTALNKLLYGPQDFCVIARVSA